MDPTAAFVALVQGPEAELALDRAALLIAAHADPGLDVEGELAELDRLADGCPRHTFEGWRQWLFEELRFTGNVEDYYDPANSLLHEVRRRRVGLPITLSVLGMAVGGRLGVPVGGVGMPGHFLLRRLDARPPQWVDPFLGGRLLDREGCEERFRIVNGPGVPFLLSYLEPIGPRPILARMLANLRGVYASRGNLEALRWVYELRLSIPGVPRLERRDLARVLGSSGRFQEAADTLETLAQDLPEEAGALRAEAQALRARLN